jgi:hypothetical protein
VENKMTDYYEYSTEPFGYEGVKILYKIQGENRIISRIKQEFKKLKKGQSVDLNTNEFDFIFEIKHNNASEMSEKVTVDNVRIGVTKQKFQPNDAKFPIYVHDATFQANRNAENAAFFNNAVLYLLYKYINENIEKAHTYFPNPTKTPQNLKDALNGEPDFPALIRTQIEPYKNSEKPKKGGFLSRVKKFVFGEFAAEDIYWSD